MSGGEREESTYVELRLADSLRLRRQKRNLSRTELARLVHSSQSRVAKTEGGDPTVSIDMLIRSLLALGASTRDLACAISGERLAMAAWSERPASVPAVGPASPARSWRAMA